VTAAGSAGDELSCGEASGGVPSGGVPSSGVPSSGAPVGDLTGAPPAGDDFASRVVSVVEAIPPGRAMTYGGVAAAVGSRSSRGVGQVMAHAGSELPWWRVVRASGLAPQGHEQRALEQYRVEGTPLRWARTGTFRVDLARASWWPDD